MVAMAEPIKAEPHHGGGGAVTAGGMPLASSEEYLASSDLLEYRLQLERELERIKAHTAGGVGGGGMWAGAPPRSSVSVSVVMQPPQPPQPPASWMNPPTPPLVRPPGTSRQRQAHAAAAAQVLHPAGNKRRGGAAGPGATAARRSKTKGGGARAIFSCTHPGCGYAASQRRYLKEHVRTHTGNKPYKCGWPGCDYASAGGGHVARHMRTHTGVRDNPAAAICSQLSRVLLHSIDSRRLIGDVFGSGRSGRTSARWRTADTQRASLDTCGRICWCTTLERAPLPGLGVVFVSTATAQIKIWKLLWDGRRER